MTRNTFLFPITEKRCAPWAQCAHKTPCITYHIFEDFGRVKIYKKIAENMYVLPNGGKKFQRKSCIITRTSGKFFRNGTFSEENKGCIVMKSVPKTAPDQRTGAAQNVKESLARERQSLPPGVVLRAANQKTMIAGGNHTTIPSCRAKRD